MLQACVLQITVFTQPATAKLAVSENDPDWKSSTRIFWRMDTVTDNLTVSQARLKRFSW